MATLLGRDYIVGEKSVSLRPITPVNNQDANQYIFEVSENLSSTPWLQTYSIEDWGDGPYELLQVARVFQQVAKITNIYVPMVLSGTNMKHPHCSVSINAGWLQVTVTATMKTDVINIVFYTQEGKDSYTYRRLVVQSSVQNCERFGEDLEREIISCSPYWVKANGFLWVEI